MSQGGEAPRADRSGFQHDGAAVGPGVSCRGVPTGNHRDSRQPLRREDVGQPGEGRGHRRPHPARVRVWQARRPQRVSGHRREADPRIGALPQQRLLRGAVYRRPQLRFDDPQATVTVYRLHRRQRVRPHPQDDRPAVEGAVGVVDDERLGHAVEHRHQPVQDRLQSGRRGQLPAPEQCQALAVAVVRLAESGVEVVTGHGAEPHLVEDAEEAGGPGAEADRTAPGDRAERPGGRRALDAVDDDRQPRLAPVPREDGGDVAEPVGRQVDRRGGGQRVSPVGDVGTHRVSPAEEQVPDLHRPAVRAGASVHDGAERGRRIRPDEEVHREAPGRRDVERGVRGDADLTASVEVQAAAPPAGGRRRLGRAERPVMWRPAGEERRGVRHRRRGAGLVVEVVEGDGLAVDRVGGGREPRHREVRPHEVQGGAAGAGNSALFVHLPG